MFDVIIRGGDVVDGTGAPRRRADVGITGGRITEIDDLSDAEAATVIDAAGKVVAPGFIDVHTHFDAQVFWDSSFSPSPLHGVTTVLAGNCGFSIAPCPPELRGSMMRTLEGVEDFSGVRRVDATDRGNPPVPHGDVSAPRRRAGAVDDRTAAYQKVVCGHGLPPVTSVSATAA